MVHGFHRKEARAVEVDIGVEVITAEGVDLRGKALGDMGITQVLAYHRTVFGLHQGIVIAVAGSRLGELDVKFVEELRHPESKTP